MKFDQDVVKFLQSEMETYRMLARDASDDHERLQWDTQALALTTTISHYYDATATVPP